MTSQRRSSTGSSIMAIVMLIGIIMVLYFVATSVISLLSFLAPVLIILTAIINHKVIIDFGKWIISLFKRSPFMGIAAGIGTFIAFPLVAGYLFFKAVAGWQLKKVLNKKEEFSEYEEVTEEVDDEDFLELPEIEKVQQTQQAKGTTSKNEYEDLF